MKRKKVIELLALFFVCMAVFTILSRAADGVTIARVQISALQNLMITHRVTAAGRVEGTVNQAVFTQEGQRVQAVHVQEGQKVAKGDVLFQVDREVLQESIENLQNEVEKLSMSQEDLERKQQLDAQDQEEAIARAQEDCRLTEEKGEIAINSAQSDLQTAINKLNSLYDRRAAGEEGLVEQIMAQKEAVKAKRDQLNSVIIQRNDDVTAAQRALEDAKKPVNPDSSAQTSQIDKEQKEKELERLKVLEKAQGQVKAPEDGILNKLQVQVGSRTTQEAAAILTLQKGDYILTGTIDKDSAKYVEKGDEVSLKNSSGKDVPGGSVLRVQEDEEDKNLRRVTVSVPADSMELGEMAEFTVSQDQGPYAGCIPLSALHEANTSRFVYVLEESSSILGEELTARKVEVQVKDKNEQYAALEEGSLSSTQKIIVSSDREIQGGSRVRLEEP